jgi:RimJ/RimL family protein N-acetyltransferase
VELATRRLRMRPWRESDREPFAALNADPEVMAFFPALLSRAASDASIDAWQAQFTQRGWSNWALELADSGQFIGYTGLSVPVRVLPFSPCVEIGWRLPRFAWGHGYATEAAREALRFGFEDLGLPEIVSFTTHLNVRSRAVMERIGMRDAQQDFTYPSIPAEHPHQPFCLYRITRDHWAEVASPRAGPGPVSSG